MNTTQTQVRSTDEALSVFDTLKLALEALETHVPHVYKDRGYAPITAIKESLISLCDGAQQPQNEVRGLSHSNEQSKCNHTKTITRADIDGNQIETTCGECGERVAQQPQDVVRGLLSNEQVEPVAWRVRWPKMGGGYAWVMNDAPLMAEHGFVNEPLYAHPPVPYVVEPRTAQPKEPEQEPVVIPDWPESESLADLEYAQNTPETWEPEYRQVWQELQVAERNKAILRRYAKELRALLTTPPYVPTERQRTWVGLTDVERIELMESTHPKNRWTILELCEAKLRKLNESQQRNPQFKEFIKWVEDRGHDAAHTYNPNTGKWICLNSMTADLWKAWEAAHGIKE